PPPPRKGDAPAPLARATPRARPSCETDRGGPGHVPAATVVAAVAVVVVHNGRVARTYTASRWVTRQAPEESLRWFAAEQPSSGFPAGLGQATSGLQVARLMSPTLATRDDRRLPSGATDGPVLGDDADMRHRAH